MADSEQIKRVDVIAADVFTQPAEEAKILLDQINLVVKGMKEMLAVSSKDLSITTTKDSAEVAKMAAQIKDLEDKIKLLNVAKQQQKVLLTESERLTKKLAAAEAAEAIEIEKLKIQIKGKNQANREEAILNNKLTTQYEKNVVLLSRIKREMKELETNGIKAPRAMAKEFDRLEKSVSGAEQKVKENFRNIGNYKSALSGAATSILSATGVTLGIGGIIAGLKSGIDTAREFEQSIANIQAVTGLSGAGLESVKKSAIELSVVYGKSASEIADAITLIGSKKPELLENKEALIGVTDSALLLSKAAKIDVPTAAEALTKALNKFDLPASQAGKVVDVLAAAAQLGAVEIAELSDQMGAFGGIAKNTGLNVAQSASIIEVVGKTVDESGRKIRNILVDLSSGDKKYNPKIVGLTTALNNLAKDGFEDTAKAADRFGKENVEAAVQLIKHRGEVEKMSKSLDINGIALKQAEANTNTLNGSLDKFSATWDALVLSFGGSSGAMKSVVDFFTDVAKGIYEVGEAEKELKRLGSDIFSRGFLGFGAASTNELAAANQLLDIMKFTKSFILKNAEDEKKLIANNKILADDAAQFVKQLNETDDEDTKNFLRAKIKAYNELITLTNKTILDGRVSNKKVRTEEKTEDEESAKEKAKRIKEKVDADKKAFDDIQSNALLRIALLEDEQLKEVGILNVKYNKLKYGVKKGSDELLLLEENFLKEYAEIKKKYDDKRKEELKPKSPKKSPEMIALKDINTAKIDELKQQQRKELDIILSGAKEGIERRNEIIQSGIQKELTQTERAIEKQQQLAAQGLENTLAYQEKRRAELEAKAVREKEAARQKEEAIQLAGAYLSAYRARMDKDNQTSTAALSGALSDVLLAKAISSSVAGAFAEGVEDFQGKGTGTSDSNLIAFSHGESVVTAKATKQYSGLVTAMNKGLVDDYVNEMIMPDLDARPSQNGNSFQSAAIIYALNTKLDSLEKAIKNKQEIKVNWDAQGARVEEIVKDGMRVVTKHVTTGKRRL